MGELDVVSVVTSILAALNNGIHIFQRLGKKKRKTKARPPRPSEEEAWQEHSLTNRPAEIRHSYNNHVSRHGRRFEVGDDTAHISLARTLLVLNTGLVNFLNHALSKDSKSISTSRKALFTLSETATMETLTTLGQLSSRLSLNQPTEPRLGPSEDDTTKHHKRKKRHNTTQSSASNRPHPSPLLANGGWVRSKSGSSVVSRAEAKRARNAAEEFNSRSRSTPTLAKTSISQVNILPSTSEARHRGGNSRHHRRRASEEDPHLHGLPNAMVVSSQSLGHHLQQGEGSNRLQKTPHIRPVAKTKPRPISTATFLTTSTKIGEIPESKWYDTILSPEELASRRIPYIVPPPLDTGEPKRKTKGFKFWKRDEKKQEILSH